MRLDECTSVSDSIVRDIQNYDASLRLRCARTNGKVRLERKVTHSAPLNPAWFKKYDDYETARDGYLSIMEFEPTETNFRKVVYSLYMMDMWRFGGPLAIINAIEKKEADKKVAEQVRRHDDFTMLFKDLWRHINTPRTVPEGAGRHAYLGNGRGESLD